MKGEETQLLTKRDMTQYVAILLCMHTLVLDHGEIHQRREEVWCNGAPTLETVQWIYERLLAYTVPGRGRDGQTVWMSRRDHTKNLTEFKNATFKDTRKIYLHMLHIFITVEDDLSGTQGDDNQVKMLSTRKADKERGPLH